MLRGSRIAVNGAGAAPGVPAYAARRISSARVR